MQKSQKLKKFLMEVFPCSFPISGIKKVEKVNSFRFCDQRRGKM